MQPGIMLQPGMPQQQQQVVVIQTMARGLAQCYYKDCPNMGAYQCRAILCCKNYGCDRMMCDDHRTKKCIARNGKHGPHQYVCLDDEVGAYRCSWLICLIPFGLVAFVGIAMLL